MTFSIRPAREADAPAMVAVLNAIIATGAFTIMDQPLTIADQLDFIQSLQTHGVFNVAVAAADQAVWGMQSVEPFAPLVNALQQVGDISTFVALNVRQHGVGRALSRATLAGARAQGFRKIMATIRADNPAAVAFYLRQGFTIIGTARQHAVVQGKLVDEVLMEQVLLNHS